MAHKKGVGSSDNGRDSHSKRLGVKLFGGQSAISGNIIIRQRGTRFHPGEGVDIGRDHTIYATTDGVVTFKKRKLGRTFVSVIPKFVEVEETIAPVKKAAVVKAPVAPVIEESAENKVEEAVAAPKAEKAAKETAPKKVIKDAAPKAEKPAKEVAPKPAKAAAPKAVKEETAPKKVAKAAKADDLKLVEGIGAKIEELLHTGGIVSFNDLANAELSKIQEILDAAGPKYNIHDPGTWSQQAKLAADGKWDDLMELQDKLKGGK